MKRRHALQPLSREHHTALVAAQLLKKDSPDYEGLPSTISGKREYFLDLFSAKLKPHFAVEEQIIALLPEVPENLAVMHQQVLEEHRQLIRLAERIDSEPVSAQLLDEAGTALAAYVRFEEREWFQALQDWIVEQGFEERIAELTNAK